MTVLAEAPGGWGLRRALPFVAIGLAIVVLGLVNRSARREGEPLDPRATAPLGARALVLLLEQFDAEVSITEGTVGDAEIAVVLRDQMSRKQAGELQSWVEDGGTLVVADPFSDFSPALAFETASLLDHDQDATDLRPRCAVGTFEKVRAIQVPGAAGFRVRGTDVGCFPVGEGSYVVVRELGAGTVIAVGGGGAFVNRQLDDADNAVFALSLMAPHPATRVSIIERSPAGSGDKGLFALVSRRVKNGLWQLLVAFVVFALWRARRLGRPVAEVQPVQIPGSELVVAVGNLLQQARRRDAAASMLRASLRRTMAERLGLPLDAAPEVFASAAAARAGADAEAIANALQPRTPASDDELVVLAQSVATLRNEVTHAR